MIHFFVTNCCWIRNRKTSWTRLGAQHRHPNDGCWRPKTRPVLMTNTSGGPSPVFCLFEKVLRVETWPKATRNLHHEQLSTGIQLSFLGKNAISLYEFPSESDHGMKKLDIWGRAMSRQVEWRRPNLFGVNFSLAFLKAVSHTKQKYEKNTPWNCPFVKRSFLHQNQFVAIYLGQECDAKLQELFTKKRGQFDMGMIKKQIFERFFQIVLDIPGFCWFENSQVFGWWKHQTVSGGAELFGSREHGTPSRFLMVFNTCIFGPHLLPSFFGWRLVKPGFGFWKLTGWGISFLLGPGAGAWACWLGAFAPHQPRGWWTVWKVEQVEVVIVEPWRFVSGLGSKKRFASNSSWQTTGSQTRFSCSGTATSCRKSQLVGRPWDLPPTGCLTQHQPASPFRLGADIGRRPGRPWAATSDLHRWIFSAWAMAVCHSGPWSHRKTASSRNGSSFLTLVELCSINLKNPESQKRFGARHSKAHPSAFQTLALQKVALFFVEVLSKYQGHHLCFRHHSWLSFVRHNRALEARGWDWFSLPEPIWACTNCTEPMFSAENSGWKWVSSAFCLSPESPRTVPDVSGLFESDSNFERISNILNILHW